MPDILEYCKGRKAETFKSGAVLINEGGEERKLFVLIDMPYSATVKALSTVKAYVIDDPIAFLGSQAEIALELAALLARRLYYTTSYLVDLQQQAAGRREDLDIVDQILAQLVQSPDDVKTKKKK